MHAGPVYHNCFFVGPLDHSSTENFPHTIVLWHQLRKIFDLCALFGFVFLVSKVDGNFTKPLWE